MKKNSFSISVIIPVFNEEGNINKLHEEIVDICSKNKFNFEIVIIDDGSTDRTQEICKSLSPVTYIRFRKNFGQTAAMDAGIKNAKNNYIITIDGDMQNDPKDIPNLINHLLKNNYDVVSGWRRKRKDRFLKKFISKGAHLLRSLMINDGIHDSGCSLKIFRRECFKNITLFGEMHRFIPAILKIKGFKIGELEVNHRPRTKGKTNYNWRRTIKGFIDMLAVWFWNKYAVRPLHLLGGIGLFFCFIGFISGLITIYEFIKGISLSDTVWPLLTIFLTSTGIQLFIFGLIADIMSKTYYETTKDQSYSIKEIIKK